MPRLIAITGGIGTGKSIVSQILRINSYIVYDCDSEAKKLMDRDISIHSQLNEHIHPNAVKNGIIDRKLIAGIVFSDPDKLQQINKIVHLAVINDILAKAKTHIPHDILFIETAILYQSNIDLIVNEVWNITAPMGTRIKRVMKRNSCTPDEVQARIKAQNSFKATRQHPVTRNIINDDCNPILPQLLELLKEF